MSTTEQKAPTMTLGEWMKEDENAEIRRLSAENEALRAGMEAERAAFKICAQERYNYHANLVDMRYQLTAVTNERDALRAQVEALTKPQEPDGDRFEAWAREQTWIKDTQKSAPGEYGHWDTKKAWEAWKAATLATPSPLTRPAVPEGWKHDCAALLSNDVELWIDACPHCGKPRPALAAAPQPEAQPSDRDAIFKALQETQEAIDVSQCPWCGGWGPQYRDNDRPVAYCHHEFTLRPWKAFATGKPEAQPTEAAQKGGV